MKLSRRQGREWLAEGSECREAGKGWGGRPSQLTSLAGGVTQGKPSLLFAKAVNQPMKKTPIQNPIKTMRRGVGGEGGKEGLLE